MPTVTSDNASYCVCDTHTVDKNGEKRYKVQPIKTGNIVVQERLCGKIGQMAAIPPSMVDTVLKTLRRSCDSS